VRPGQVDPVAIRDTDQAIHETEHQSNREVHTDMFNVCPQCGHYSVEKTNDPSGPFAVCPQCGHRHPFLMLPLFVITGTSGSGKTTLALKPRACATPGGGGDGG
jgi:ribosomal protein L32